MLSRRQTSAYCSHWWEPLSAASDPSDTPLGPLRTLLPLCTVPLHSLAGRASAASVLRPWLLSSFPALPAKSKRQRQHGLTWSTVLGVRSCIHYSPVCFASLSHDDFQFTTSQYGVACAKAGYAIHTLAVPVRGRVRRETFYSEGSRCNF